MIFPLFPTGVNVEACGIYSLAILQGKAEGQKQIIMSSSPESVNKGCSLGKLAYYLPRVVLHPRGWLAGVCIFPTCPPTPWHRQAAVEQGILAGAKRKGTKSREVFQPNHSSRPAYLSICDTKGLFVARGNKNP